MRHQVGGFVASAGEKRRSHVLACGGLALNLALPCGADHLEGMRKFGLLVLVVLMAGLAACAETAGPEYAYAPPAASAYAPGYPYGVWPDGTWPYAYGPWPEGYLCCGPGLVEFGHFHHFQHFNHFGGHGHFGHGGRH
jgi:hypothetical protein